MTQSIVDDSGKGWELLLTLPSWKARQRWGSSEGMGESSPVTRAGRWEKQSPGSPARRGGPMEAQGGFDSAGRNEEAEEGSAGHQFLA